MSDDWRIPTDAATYLSHQQKRTNFAERRPVIRRASDLVGPGIGAHAVRLTDYNNLLSTFNGYYSSAPETTNAPPGGEAFVGYVISDAELGGLQVFTGLTTGTEYRRTFTRNPTDPELITWGSWA